MPTYLVIKRMKEDRTYMPTETVVDIPRADLLIQRGYIIPVPDDYAERKAASEAAASGRRSVESLLDQGYSEGAAKHIASGKDEADWPKYVKQEHEKITAREATRAERTQIELDRLATAIGVTADDILDLSDTDYADLLDDNPSPAGTAASDASEVGDDNSNEQRPFEALMAMPKEGLEANMADNSIQTPGVDDWYENETMRTAVVREILIKAGYSDQALEPAKAEAE